MTEPNSSAANRGTRPATAMNPIGQHDFDQAEWQSFRQYILNPIATHLRSGNENHLILPTLELKLADKFIAKAIKMSGTQGKGSPG